MEDNMNSCLMWAVGLYTPVDLGSVFDSADYKGVGLELDSHITLLYAQGKILPKATLFEDLKTNLGESRWESITSLISGMTRLPILDAFELGSFENDSDYVVLKLKKGNNIYEFLRMVNIGLREKYGVNTEFSQYTPHITLAELNPGTAKKYVESECLKNVLKNSLLDFEDLVVSYGTSSEITDRKQYFLTQYKNIDRYFRLRNLKEGNKLFE